MKRMFGEYSVENVHVRHDLGKVDDVLAIMAGPEIQMPKSDSRLAYDVRVDGHKFAYSCFSMVGRAQMPFLITADSTNET